MSRWIARIREAEEQLAGIARALQTAFESDVSEVATVREASQRGLVRAQAVSEAARMLGYEDIAARVTDVMAVFREAEFEAGERLQAMAQVEQALQGRQLLPAFDAAPTPARPALISAPPVTTPAPVPTTRSAALEKLEQASQLVDTVASALTTSNPMEVVVPTEPPAVEVPAAAEAPVVAVATVDIPAFPASDAGPAVEMATNPGEESSIPAPSEDLTTVTMAEAPLIEAAAAPEVVVETAPALRIEEQAPAMAADPIRPGPATGASRDEASRRLQQLAQRVEELEKVAGRWSRTLVTLTVGEYAALTRILGEKLAGEAGPEAYRVVSPLLRRMQALCARLGIPAPVGVGEGDTGDWGRLAAEARRQRSQLAGA